MRVERLLIVAPGLLQHAQSDGDDAAVSVTQKKPLNRNRPSATFAKAPSLRRLIAIAGAAQRDADYLEALLMSCYGLVRQADWPVAPVLLLAANIDPGKDYWLVAEPVNLVAGHNDVHLASAAGDITGDEAAAFITRLNSHFESDGLVFVAPQPQRWFVRAPRPQDLTTHSLTRAVGRPLRELLPVGSDAGKWRRWQDEIQMLLHAEGVNSERAARGRAAINGVWFWGGGTCPRQPASAQSIATWSDDPIAGALGHFVGGPVNPLPSHLDEVLRDNNGCTTQVMVLPRASQVPNADWESLEHAWFQPAWAALRYGAVNQATLITDGEGTTMWSMRHPTLWQRLMLRFREPKS